jgi:hypothetical protein
MSRTAYSFRVPSVIRVQEMTARCQFLAHFFVYDISLYCQQEKVVFMYFTTIPKCMRYYPMSIAVSRLHATGGNETCFKTVIDIQVPCDHQGNVDDMMQ